MKDANKLKRQDFWAVNSLWDQQKKSNEISMFILHALDHNTSSTLYVNYLSGNGGWMGFLAQTFLPKQLAHRYNKVSLPLNVLFISTLALSGKFMSMKSKLFVKCVRAPSN